MYKWRIIITLKNSGKELRAVYTGDEISSSNIFKKVFCVYGQRQVNNFIGLQSEYDESMIFVNIADIAAVCVSGFEEDT